MKCSDLNEISDAYLDDALPPTERQAVDAHLQTCAVCRTALDGLRVLRGEIARLPRELPPARDLWPGIRAQLDSDCRAAARRQAKNHQRHGDKRRPYIWLPLAAALAVAAIAFWFRPATATPSWQVDTVSGKPRVGPPGARDPARLHLGDWLETDSVSRARLTVGTIGEVNVEPNSRLRLVKATSLDHRLELARGTMHALIWAPPRLFFVETPSATAIDLGCAYTLTVDDRGTGVLQVTAGYVALAHGGHESIIPAGQMCFTRPGAGPGTPFAADTSPALRTALERFDFAAGGADALAAVLAQAGDRDKVMLWHLLDRAPVAQRGGVFDKLAGLQPPPAGVTRDGILAGDAGMRARWALDLGLLAGLPARP
jgi:hypothetical protein